jgi:hypothetical protein
MKSNSAWRMRFQANRRTCSPGEHRNTADGPSPGPPVFPGKKEGSLSGTIRFQKRGPTRLLPKRYKTEEGLEIWVGRNDEGNDYLTTRLARGNDLFFHLEGYPGATWCCGPKGAPIRRPNQSWTPANSPSTIRS